MSFIRNILLGSLAALAAATVISAPAAAQQPKPNILVIMGDDIGTGTSAPTTAGMMGYPNTEHRQYRQGRRDIQRSLRSSSPVPPGGRLHHRPKPVPHRLAQGRPARCQGRLVRQGPDAGGTAEAAGLCLWPIRQEPPWRPQRVPAHRSRLRRVFRQSLSPQRRGRTRKSGLSQEPAEFNRRGSVRAKSSNTSRRIRTIPPMIRASARWASRPSRTPAR